MKKLIPERQHFDQPELLSMAWSLKKGDRKAWCAVWSHQVGFELRLVVTGDEFPRTRVCPSQEDVIEMLSTWRAALEANGWEQA